MTSFHYNKHSISSKYISPSSHRIKVAVTLGVFPLKGKIAALGPTLNLDGAEVGCDDQELCPELDKNLRTTTRKTKTSISAKTSPYLKTKHDKRYIIFNSHVYCFMTSNNISSRMLNNCVDTKILTENGVLCQIWRI